MLSNLLFWSHKILSLTSDYSSLCYLIGKFVFEEISLNRTFSKANVNEKRSRFKRTNYTVGFEKRIWKECTDSLTLLMQKFQKDPCFLLYAFKNYRIQRRKIIQIHYNLIKKPCDSSITSKTIISKLLNQASIKVSWRISQIITNSCILLRVEWAPTPCYEELFQTSVNGLAFPVLEILEESQPSKRVTV